jgi:predicted aspartyl protease
MRLRHLTIVLTCATAAVLATPSYSASDPLPPASGTPVTAAATDIVDLGQDRDLRMTVPVSIGGKGPFPFIVDTGSERTVLSEELAVALGLSPRGVAEVHSVAGVGTVGTVAVESLSVSKTSARDLTAPLLKQRNLGAPGILGIDSLQQHSVLLDFAEQTMTVMPSGRRARAKPLDDDDDAIVITARDRLGRLILADARVNHRRVAVIIDTGAEHSIGNAVLRDRVLGKQRDAFVVPTRIYSVTGEVVPAEVMLVKSMQLGSLKLTQMPIAFADVRIFRQLGLDHKPAMLLGMNTLRAFRKVHVDFANRQVTFVVPGESRRDDNARYALLDD